MHECMHARNSRGPFPARSRRQHQQHRPSLWHGADVNLGFQLGRTLTCCDRRKGGGVTEVPGFLNTDLVAAGDEERLAAGPFSGETLVLRDFLGEELRECRLIYVSCSPGSGPPDSRLEFCSAVRCSSRMARSEYLWALLSFYGRFGISFGRIIFRAE
jgi:hypothetical protein